MLTLDESKTIWRVRSTSDDMRSACQVIVKYGDSCVSPLVIRNMIVSSPTEPCALPRLLLSMAAKGSEHFQYFNTGTAVVQKRCAGPS